MFYCDQCSDLMGWPKSIMAKSYGACEICSYTSVCNDYPSSCLPKAKMSSIEASKIVEDEQERFRNEYLDVGHRNDNLPKR